jgi:ring-1,2-phenylacetyl-CoA epoxidase subunit PaaC
MQDHLYQYTLRLADNALILGQRLGELCGHGPVLEQDIAMTNIALDLIGQSRMLYQYASDQKNDHSTEDDLAFLRKENAYKNFLLVEQPNGDFAHIVARQFYFDTHNYLNYQSLCHSKDKTLAAIAEKSLKEVTYHLRYSSEWVLRLGDGTQESHQRMQQAVDDLWSFTGEMFMMNETDSILLDAGISVDLPALKKSWLIKITHVLTEACLEVPAGNWMQKGGKEGFHTEYMGYILADLQYMQRTYPGQKW